MEQKEQSKGTVLARVKQDGVKIHGPNSPDVLSGKVPEGHREVVFGKESFREVDYQTAVELWGQETADQLFSGVKEE